MSKRYDVIVVGVGSMGSATCEQLARRGLRVLGLEQFGIPHGRGAHHGGSRVIRKAYFEHPDYVPLLQRAYENWAAVERLSGRQIMHRVGGVYLGRPDSEAIAGSLTAMRLHDLPYEELTVDQLRQRYPMFRVPDDFVGLIDPETGYVVPEAAVSTFAGLTLANGGELHGHEPVLDWSESSTGVTVRTALDTYTADRIVFTSGAWSDRLLKQLNVQLRVTRQVLAWVWPREPEVFAYGKFPVWMLETGGGGQHYGFPMVHDRPGFKLALHKVADVVNPDTVDRNPQPADHATYRPLLEQYLPQADGPLLALEVCLYTNSPDSHFIIDRYPASERVVIGCGFSGHGFKFASVIGEILADLAADGRTQLPIDFLGLQRFR